MASIKNNDYLRKEKEEITQVVEYCRNMTAYLFKARFNNETWKETNDYIEKWFPHKTGCIYCSQRTLRSPHGTIPYGAPIMVLEVNEEIGQIMGVGLVANRPHAQKYMVHRENYKNAFNYVGKYRIKREEMSKEEDKIICILEAIYFNGRLHLKHGCDLNMFSPRYLWRAARVIDLVEELKKMFKTRQQKT